MKFTCFSYCVVTLLSFSMGFGNLSTTITKKPRIVIVGAGIAGLTCAYDLHKAGFEAEVYEARNRVGGRIFSASLSGKIIEFGGSNIHEGGNAEEIFRLVQEFGLTTESRKSSLNPICLTDDTVVNVNAFLDAYPLKGEALLAKLNALAKTSRNLRDILDQLFDTTQYADKMLYEFLDMALAAYRGASAENLSTNEIDLIYHFLSQDISSSDNSPYDHACVKGGNHQLPQAIAGVIEPHLHLNKQLLSISKPNHYVLLFQDEIVEADIVVLTMPCTVYNDILIDEAVIPDAKLTQIKNVRYGATSKIWVAFEELNPKENIFNDHYIALFNMANDALSLYCFNSTDISNAETLNETYQKCALHFNQVIGQKHMPSSRAVMAYDNAFYRYSGPVGHSWYHDPFSQGSDSYIAAGQEAILTAVEQAHGISFKSLFAPIHDSLYFAGEHCALPDDEIATMQGACASGVRVAQAILRSL